ncbi:MAG TPA: class I SAM-dependent methyltransferase [Nocardioidaceae bacterium]|nr:class I SAM-dependent methyltransferase [Nocardioidaceae bacterium]
MTAVTSLSPAADPQRWPSVATAPQARVAGAIAHQLFKGAIRKVGVRVVLPNGEIMGRARVGDPEMRLIRPQVFFARLGADLRIGFGEAYLAGDWTPGPSTDLADLLAPFAARMSELVPQALQRLRPLVDKAMPGHELNTVAGARTNIERHYDLSNELFGAFLDPTMSYSAARFPDVVRSLADLDLEAGQLRKIDSVLDYARVGPGTRLLEIGTGWGALALRAAQRGARVTSVTISSEQLELARRRIDAAGMSDRVELRLQDYRQVQGSFDAVVSVEMIEAVGERFWPTYFATLDRVLAPGGRVALQAITMEHHRMLATRQSYGWIQKYIFPGGLIPSLQAISDNLRQHTHLEVVERRELGWHYAETLRQWRSRFLDNWGQVADLGFDETFRRMWEFYLGYCEAGFRTGYLGVSQLAIGRRPDLGPAHRHR